MATLPSQPRGRRGDSRAIPRPARGSGGAERPLVLVAAERSEVRRLVGAALRPRGFLVAAGPDGGDALDATTVVDSHPDVVVLQSSQPAERAVGAVRDLAPERPPIVVVGLRPTPSAAVEALDAGADDYVPCPFDAKELAARLRSLIRRRGSRLATGTRRIGAALVDLDGRRVLRPDGQFALGGAEWRILVRLLEAEGLPVAHDDLLRAAFGWEARGDLATLRGTVARLRRKLGVGPREQGSIRSVRGIGYRLDEPRKR